ncbi:MAG TPA: hypothetical protein VFA53_07145 [Xanthobacteraceae bacterium]|nr:hypothetical protein [Xanthobacteraceae bacterium]
MSIVLACLISLSIGWTAAACDALFRDENRPDVFNGLFGTLFLLTLTGVGGFFAAFNILWMFRTIHSSAILVIIAGGAYLGFTASNRLHVNAAGAANRFVLGLGSLLIYYAVAWKLLRPVVDF